MENNTIKPARLTEAQIKELAQLFAQIIEFDPLKKNLHECVKSIGGDIITDNNGIIDSMGGLLKVNGKHDFKIILPSYTTGKRDNFTIAHELGHYVLHSRCGEIQINAFRDDSENTLSEREANCFAAEFLMPSDLVREAFSKNSSIIKLASDFDVSLSAMKWRCYKLRLIK